MRPRMIRFPFLFAETSALPGRARAEVGPYQPGVNKAASSGAELAEVVPLIVLQIERLSKII